MMDVSYISNHNSSIRIYEKTISILNQSLEAGTTLSEYSYVDSNLNSNINHVYNGFKDVTKSCHTNDSYLLMIESFGKNLSEYLEAIKQNMITRTSDNELFNSASIIQNEIKTWKLIHLLYEDRFKNISNETTNSIFHSNDIHTEFDVLIKLYKSNKDLREAQIIIDWLEHFLKEKLDNNTQFLIGSHGKSWEHTKFLINKNKFHSILNNKTSNELDPDAPLKGRLILTPNDKNEETEYLRYLYHCVQSGDFEKAKSICQNHDELWRAQTLEGWKPFYNPMGNPESRSQPDDVTGNPNRKLFKMACQKLCDNMSLDLYERAIYATLCGDLKVLTTVETEWPGLLWAHFKVYIEKLVEHCLNTFTNTGFSCTQSLFGEDTLDLSRFSALASVPVIPCGLDYMSYDKHGVRNTDHIDHIFEQISLKLARNPVAIVRAASSGHCDQYSVPKAFYESIFEMVQQYIILEDVNGLVQLIGTTITGFPSTNGAGDKNIIRFLAHLIIFLYSTHDNLDIHIYYRAIEAYIECLIEEKLLGNIAFYISKLSTDLQIKWYCRCLSGVTNPQERERCVFDGLEYDLPIIEVTRLLVHSVRLSGNNDGYYPSTGIEDRRDTGNMFISDLDKVHIDALDWLGFLQEQYCHLVRQANAFARSFIERDQLQAARMAMSKISDEVWTHLQIAPENGPAWLTCALYENECLRRYIECQDLFGDWYNHFTCQKPRPIDLDVGEDLNKLSFVEKQMLQKKHDDFNLAQQEWTKLLDYHVNKTFDCFVSMLKMGECGWLSDVGDDSVWIATNGTGLSDLDNDQCQNRKQEIERLRSKCIVSIIFMSIGMITSSGHHEKSFVITDLLADGEWQLCSVFEKAQLRKLLQKVRNCSLQLMREGKDAFGVTF